MLLTSTCTIRGLAALAGGLLCLLPLAASAETAADLENLQAQAVQTIANGQAGTDRLNGFAPPLIHRQFLYVCCEQGILYFHRNLQTGRLEYAGKLADVPQRLEDAFPGTRTWGYIGGRSCLGAFASGRLYVVSRSGTAMGWYEINAQVGEPVEKGVVACPPCSQIVVSPDQKDVYVRTVANVKRLEPAILWYHLDADGKPVRSGQTRGKGLGGGHDSNLLMSPDGKSLYSISVKDHAIARIERKPTGEIAYKAAVSMEPAVSVKESTNYFPSLAITPDGKWLYAAGIGYGAAGSYGIFKRDSQTGELSHQETVRVAKDKDPIARVLWWRAIFLPDGSGGFLGGLHSLMTFKVDGRTGRLAKLAGFKGLSGLGLVADRENGLFYECHYTNGHDGSTAILGAMRIGQKPPPKPPLPAGQTPAKAARAVEHVQTLLAGQLRGLITRPLFNPVSADLNGDYLYLSGEDGILYFQQDAQTGKLSLGGQVGSKRSPHSNLKITFAGGRMYAARAKDGEGLTWYQIDARTGKPTRQGVVACPSAYDLVASPDQKDLYVKVRTAKQQNKMLRFQLDAKGKPVAAGEVTGKGIGWTGHSEWPGLLRITPDGKYLYCISADDHAIACIERKPTGEMARKSSFDLEPLAKRDPGNYHYRWASLRVSPDGKWLYAALWNGKRGENRYGIFRRNPGSGALALRETIDGDKDSLANQRAWSVAFLPDGAGGFLSGCASPVFAFKYDSKTGRLTDAAVVKETRLDDVRQLVLDGKRGYLYGSSFQAIHAFKPSPSEAR